MLKPFVLVPHRNANHAVTGFAERREGWDLEWVRR